MIHVYLLPRGEVYGRIQIDRSGQGHCWETVHPDDLRVDALEALADNGMIRDGATANVGGMDYRAIVDDVFEAPPVHSVSLALEAVRRTL